MALTKEQLMAPRYKATGTGINHYPGSYWEVGDIIQLTNFDRIAGKVDDYWAEDEDGKHLEYESFFKAYPHLFQPLPWYAERKLEDLPEYVKVNTEATCLFLGNVLKVKLWKVNPAGWFYCWVEEDKAKSMPELFKYSPDTFLPADLTDYEQYIKEKQ